MHRLVVAIVLFSAALSITECARAAEHSVITEFGMGYKIEHSTSWLLLPQCKQAVVVNPEWLPENPRGSNPYGCGGDNPAFIGWPIAYEWEGDDEVWRFRVGYFHYSNWFDGGQYLQGGDQWETRMDLFAVTATFNWTEMRKKKRGN